MNETSDILDRLRARFSNENLLRHAAATFIAAAATAFAASLLQSELNLHELRLLDVPITSEARLRSILHDLRHFMPFFALPAFVAFVFAFPVAVLLWFRIPYWQLPIAMVAGFTGLWVAFMAVDSVSPLPTLFAATRDLPGRIAMAATGAIGGLIYAAMLRKPESHEFSSLRTDVLIASGTAVLFVGLYLSTMSGKSATAEPIPEAYGLEVVADGLVHPWGLAFLPDGRALVTERPGRLRILSADGKLLADAVEGLPDNLLVAGQGGLMDVQVLPGEQDSDVLVFLTYSCGQPTQNNTCVMRARLDGMRLVEQKVLLSAKPKHDSDSQYGSRLQFLPDGSLLITIGDGMDFREGAQRLTKHYGKIVRLNPGGSVPGDNPFHDQPGILAEIYSYGHRNPQGLVYDPERDKVFAHEHGPDGGDELNRIQPGGNYGWPIATYGINYPGDRISPYTEYPDTILPLKQWTPSIAPSGLAVYYGDRFAEWNGDLLIGAMAGKSLVRLRLDGDEVVEEQRLFESADKRFRHVVIGPGGHIYLLTDHDPGQVMRVVRKTAGQSAGANE